MKPNKMDLEEPELRPEVLTTTSKLPDDPNDDYYLTNCFVCQEISKPGQVIQISYSNVCIRDLDTSAFF